MSTQNKKTASVPSVRPKAGAGKSCQTSGPGGSGPGGSGPRGSGPGGPGPRSKSSSTPKTPESELVVKPSSEGFDPTKTWLNVCDEKKGDVPLAKPPTDGKPEPVKRTGWKTIRIFVSSTFKDFHSEREVLVKKVFPDLRAWCQKQRLHLVECDLRWGVPKNSPTETTLRACLEEIDRCIDENTMPYFINMTSERVGWIPEQKEIPGEIEKNYRWVHGMSVTEMEIVHGAYRKENPNALFLLRSDSFVGSIKDDQTKKDFRDYENEVLAEKKLPVLKEKIGERFPPHRVLQYKCEYKGVSEIDGKVQLKMEDGLEEKILAFFKERIIQQYPRVLTKEYDDPLDRQTEQQEAFMKSRVDFVLGREGVIKEMLDFTSDPGSNKPLLLVGGPGAGKSSIMAKVVDTLCELASQRKIHGGGEEGWLIAYHFVGAVPGSTDLTTMLKRLLKLIGMDEESESGDLTSLKQSCCSALTNPNTRPVVLVVDAVNQLDEDTGTEFTWLPSVLSPSVRVVLSMIDNSGHHTAIRLRENKPREISVPAFSLIVRKDIIKNYLKRHNKELNTDQMVAVLEKSSQPSSNNPLWLTVACEELRVWGLFRKLDDKIDSLPDNLLGLLEHVFVRFEEELEDDADLMKATLCLLETSKTGLCEVEILEILGDDTCLLPPAKLQPSGRLFKPSGNVAALRWHSVYRNLRPYLRPYGESGEGRLDFYHRTLSKVVRKRYLKADDKYQPDEAISKWWHRKLADFFEQSPLHERKVEEYPNHLIAIGDDKRLKSFLLDWETLESLYDQDCSVILLKYWREVAPDSSYSQMATECPKFLQKYLEDASSDDKQKCMRTVLVATLLLQAHELDKSLELGRMAEKMAEGRSGMPSDIGVEIYKLFAEINSQKVSEFDEVCEKQAPNIQECLKYNDKTVELLRGGKGRDAKKTLGYQLLKRAKARSQLVDLVGVHKGEAPKGLKDVDEAMAIFKELKDNNRIAEALLQKAGLMNLKLEEAYKIYKEALDLCLKTNGKFHILSSRLFKNTGICAEDLGINLKDKGKVKSEQYRKYREQSYKYYKEYYEVNIEIFGRNHPKTKTAKTYIKEYADIAKALGHTFDFLSSN